MRRFAHTSIVLSAGPAWFLAAGGSACPTTALHRATLSVERAERRRVARQPHGLVDLVAERGAASGRWPAWSLDKERGPDSELGHSMTDAATAYAVMALAGAG